MAFKRALIALLLLAPVPLHNAQIDPAAPQTPSEAPSIPPAETASATSLPGQGNEGQASEFNAEDFEKKVSELITTLDTILPDIRTIIQVIKLNNVDKLKNEQKQKPNFFNFEPFFTLLSSIASQLPALAQAFATEVESRVGKNNGDTVKPVLDEFKKAVADFKTASKDFNQAKSAAQFTPYVNALITKLTDLKKQSTTDQKINNHLTTVKSALDVAQRLFDVALANLKTVTIKQLGDLVTLTNKRTSNQTLTLTEQVGLSPSFNAVKEGLPSLIQVVQAFATFMLQITNIAALEKSELNTAKPVLEGIIKAARDLNTAFKKVQEKSVALAGK